MQNSIGSVWVKKLQRWGLGAQAAALLEAAGPLTLVAAQLIYLSKPLFSGMHTAPDHWDALAHMLEDQEETRSFIASIQKENSI